jgi:long-subunit fatty acid transport protein
MKNQITILFAGGLLAATAVMAAPATAQSGTTFVDRSSNYIAISIDPQDAKAYNDRGFAKYKLGNFKGAITDFDRAIRINPQFAEAYTNRGNTKLDLGDKKGATAEDGAQASPTTIVPSVSILNRSPSLLKMPKLITIGVMLNIN